MNEDFVSFDLAKKLKEKGFNQKCLAYYDVEDNVGLLYNTQYTDEALPCQYTDLLQCHNTGEAETQPDDSGFCVDAPTIPQVLKWLRDSNAIHIHICLYSKGWYCDVYTFKYYEEDREYGAKHIVQLDEFSTYESAALAGIEYALDNVI
jgi:hypothetical protein